MKPYYQNELTTIYNGDCLDVMDYMIKNGITADFVFTSPPYNRIRNDKYKHYSDNKTNYYDFLVDVIGRTLEIGNYVFFNIQQTFFNTKDVHKMIGHFSEYIVNNIIWVKTNPQPNNNIHSVVNAYEYILVFSKKEDTAKAKIMNTKNVINSAVYSQNPFKDKHNAVMHPNIVKWFIERFTNESDTILDIFMGTGTTNYYSCEMNRKNIGIELSKEYCDISIKRLNNLQLKFDI